MLFSWFLVILVNSSELAAHFVLFALVRIIGFVFVRASLFSVAFLCVVDFFAFSCMFIWLFVGVWKCHLCVYIRRLIHTYIHAHVGVCSISVVHVFLGVVSCLRRVLGVCVMCLLWFGVFWFAGCLVFLLFS